MGRCRARAVPRVKAQNATPAAMQELADKYTAVKEKLTAATVKLTNEQAVNAALWQIVAEARP